MKVKDLEIDYVSHIYLIPENERGKMFVAHFPSDLKLSDIKVEYAENECEIVPVEWGDGYADNCYVVCNRLDLEVYI